MFNWLNHLKIQNKLIIAFLIIVLISAVSLGWNIFSIRQMHSETQEIVRETQELLNLEEAQINLLEQGIAEKNFLLTGNIAFVESHQELTRAITEIFQRATSQGIHEEDEQEALGILIKEIDEYENTFAQVVALYNEGKPEEATRLSQERYDDQVQQVHDQIEAFLVDGRNVIEEEAARADQQAQTVTLTGFISLALSIVLSLGIGVFLARSISKPLTLIVQGANLLATGDTGLTGLDQVEVSQLTARRDEMGAISRAFSALIAYFQEMAVAAGRLAQGDVATDVIPQSDRDVLGNAFSQMILYQQQMAEAAGRLAQGDLTANVIPQSDKDVLGNAFSQMITYQQQMAGVAGRLAQGDVAADVIPQSDRDVLGNAFSQMIVYQQQMAAAAGRLAQGDLTTSITPQSDQDGLGNAFSLMIANLRNLISQVADTADTVGAASDQLATAASQAGQASQQVTSTIQQIAQGTTQQTQAVTEATNNTEQTARAAEGIAKGAQEQAQGVQKTSGLVGEMANIVDQVGQVTHSVGEANAKVTQAARHGVSVVGQTSQGMDTIRARTITAADKVKEMTTRSKEIGRIVETIDDIADKTDMLALNAAVEAARAGEHGRGFAVVADQVRKLSEDSKGATRDIAELIERVQDTVREAIGAMESTVTEVDNGARLAGDTARSLEEILQAAEVAAAMAEQIGGAVSQLRQKNEGVVEAMGAVSAIVEENTSVAEEMAAGSQQVLQAMEGVASVAEENSASAEEVSASAEEMSAQVEEVVASAQELSSLAEQLQAAVAQFRVDQASPTIRPESGRSWEASRGSTSRQRPKAVATPVDRQGNGVTNLNFR